MASLKKILFFTLLFLSFFSCRKNFETDWDVDVVSPIARSSLNIKNFFPDSLFQADPTGVLHLAFSKPIATFKLDTLVKIPDTLIVDSFIVFPNFPVSPGMVLPGFPLTQELDFDVPNGVELRKVDMNDGVLKVKFTNTFTQPLTFDLTLTSAVKWGSPFHILETIPPGSVGLLRQYDLKDYSIQLTGINGNKSNTLAQKVTISIPSNAAPDTTKTGQRIRADISYSNLTPYYVEGYFGQQIIKVNYDSTALNFSNNLQVSNFKINSASINFKIVNEFGIEATAQLSNIKSINTASATSILLNAPGTSNININKAGKTSNMGNPVFPSIKTVSINTSNSNLKPFLENLPNYLAYSGSITVNPNGNVTGSNDFAFLNTGITIYADVDMPLKIQADYFKLTTTTPLDLTTVKQLDNINYGDIIIQATNGFPFSAVLQGYIINEQNQVIDSLFEVPNNVITSGIIDANNDVVQTQFTKINIPFTVPKLQNLKLCKAIKFVALFKLPPSPPEVKIYDKYTLDVILSVDVNYKARKK